MFGYNLYPRNRLTTLRRTPRLSPVKISSCTANYISARFNPCQDFVNPPCVPDLIGTPALRKSYIARGDVHCSPTNKGWLVVNPYSFLNSSGFLGSPPNLNVGAPIFASNGNQVVDTLDIGTLIDPNDPTIVGGTSSVVGIDARFFPTEWGSSTNVNTNIERGALDARIVACGIKFQYNGKADDRQGNFIMLSSDNTLMLYTAPAFTAAGMSGMEESSTFPIDEGIHSLVWHPRSRFDLDYFSNWYSGATQRSIAFDSFVVEAAQYPSLFICMDAQNDLSFHYEVCIHVELNGAIVTGKVMSDSDVLGLGAANSDIDVRPPHTSPERQERQRFLKAKHNLAMASSAAKSLKKPPAKSYSGTSNTSWVSAVGHDFGRAAATGLVNLATGTDTDLGERLYDTGTPRYGYGYGNVRRY